MKTDHWWPEWPDKLSAWAAATRTRRIMTVLTSPLWLFAAVGLFIPWALVCMFWEGDPGKLIRWVWKGKDSL